MQSMMTALRAGAEQGIGCTLSAVECRELLDRLADLARLRDGLNHIIDRAGHCLTKQGVDGDGCVRLICGYKCRETACALLASTTGEKPEAANV